MGQAIVAMVGLTIGGLLGIMVISAVTGRRELAWQGLAVACLLLVGAAALVILRG